MQKNLQIDDKRVSNLLEDVLLVLHMLHLF